MTERSAGFMIVRRVNSQIEYLLMKASEFEQNWSSPEGFVFFLYDSFIAIKFKH